MVKDKTAYELIIQTNEDTRYFADELVAFVSGVIGGNRKGEKLAEDFISTHNKKIALHEFYDKEQGEYFFFEIETTEGLYRGRDILFSEENYEDALLQLKEKYYNTAVKYIKSLEVITAGEKNIFKRKRLKNEISIKKIELETVKDRITHVPKFPAYDRVVVKFIDFNSSDLELMKERAMLFASNNKEVCIVGFKLRKIVTSTEDL